MKVGLVLEGGGMRGLYTAGVLDAFLMLIFMLMGLFQFPQEHFLALISFPNKEAERFAIISVLLKISIIWGSDPG